MRTWRRKPFAVAALTALVSGPAGTPSIVNAAGGARQDQDQGNGPRTATPIKHVIVIIGENRTFDNIYGTYVPNGGQTVENLRSRGIVRNDGSPGPQEAEARQFHLATNPLSYFINTETPGATGKAAYAPNLPTPQTNGAPPSAVTLSQFLKDPVDTVAPFDENTFSAALLHQISPVLASRSLFLLTTGATGLSNCTTDPTLPPSACNEPDTRIANFNALPNTSFQITGPKVPYDSYTGDMVHRFFHMWQQADCNVLVANASNPSGCRNDLYPYVGMARDDSGANSMGFYNVQNGDAPLFKQLADQYTMSDNYHQPVMGGTAVQHMLMMTGDALPWDHVAPFAATPPAAQIADPTPKSSTNPAFTKDKVWMPCDTTQPGVGPILDYLKTLHWRPDMAKTNCESGRFYMVNNLDPGFLENGELNTAEINAGTAAPPSSLRNIGDALNEHHIDWAYYGGGFNAARRFRNGSTNPVDVMIGTGGDFYCEICNSFQYSASIMGDPAQRAAHIKDAVDFFTDVDNGTLPAVSYIKPDSFDDGHPASSKLSLFEALVTRVINRVQADDDLFNSTAIFVTFDEGGGYWDSGFIQPLDMFGDGPRIPFIVVSPYSRGGRIVHSYGDHASILKFIERNWFLDPLTGRSRDNLPNPTTLANDPYVPTNMPAIGDLFDMFNFRGGQNQQH
jgi:phospholipase C